MRIFLLSSQPFYESLLELNALDSSRNMQLDSILDDIVMRFNEFSLEKIHDFFNSTFLIKIILCLFENTYKLINTIESDQAHKNHILTLKDKTKQHLTPILNGLEKDLLLAKAKGDQEEIIKIQTALMIHNKFLESKQDVFEIFDTAKLFLVKNATKRTLAKRIVPSTTEQLKTKNKFLEFERIKAMQDFYRYYDIITDDYQSKLWYSTAIKIYKLCKLLNEDIEDNVLKEKVENLFFQIDIKISLNTTRLNNAKCYCVTDGVAIWRDGDAKKYISKLLPLSVNKYKEQLNSCQNSSYAKKFENSEYLLFCLF